MYPQVYTDGVVRRSSIFAANQEKERQKERVFIVDHVTHIGHGSRVTFGSSSSLDFTRNVGCSAEKRPAT